MGSQMILLRKQRNKHCIVETQSALFRLIINLFHPIKLFFRGVNYSENNPATSYTKTLMENL